MLLGSVLRVPCRVLGPSSALVITDWKQHPEPGLRWKQHFERSGFEHSGLSESSDGVFCRSSLRWSEVLVYVGSIQKLGDLQDRLLSLATAWEGQNGISSLSTQNVQSVRVVSQTPQRELV